MQNLTQNLQGFVEEDSLEVPSFSKRKREPPSESNADVGITEPLSITAKPEPPAAALPEPEPNTSPAPTVSSVPAPELPAPEAPIVPPPISDPTAEDGAAESASPGEVMTSDDQGGGAAASARNASELKAIVGQLRAELMREVLLLSSRSANSPLPPPPLSRFPHSDPKHSLPQMDAQREKYIAQMRQEATAATQRAAAAAAESFKTARADAMRGIENDVAIATAGAQNAVQAAREAQSALDAARELATSDLATARDAAARDLHAVQDEVPRHVPPICPRTICTHRLIPRRVFRLRKPQKSCATMRSSTHQRRERVLTRQPPLLQMPLRHWPL